MQESRIEKLEDDLGPQGEDIIITVIEEGCELTPDGGRRTIHRTPTHYDEGQFEDWGNGTRVKLRYARYADADHGILRDKEVTGD